MEEIDALKIKLLEKGKQQQQLPFINSAQEY